MPTDSSPSLDITPIVLAVFRRIWIVIAVTLAIAVAAVALTFALTPVYRANVLLAPVPEQKSILGSGAGSLGVLGNLGGLGLGDDSRKAEYVAMLGSREIGEAFIRDRELLPVIFASRWDAERGAWKPGYAEEPPTVNKAYAVFDDQIRSVSENARTGLVELAVNWTDPVVASDWANELVARVNDMAREKARQEAQQSIVFLREELERNSAVEVREAIFTLIESHLRAITMANAREEYAFRVVDPAVAADPDQYVFPSRLIFGAIGLMVGLFLAVGLAVFLEFYRRPRQLATGMRPEML